MPELCRFFGIVIFMYFDEHEPPHFHVRYAEYRAVVVIDSGLVRGRLPSRVQALVLEWRSLHLQDLLENWNRARAGSELVPIAPLE